MSEFDAVIVGAGFSGLYAVHLLRQQGFTVRAYEKGDGVGGTWYWNRYPGARCDVESIDYQYSFAPELVQEWRWSERYPAQAEILSYLDHVADRFDLRRDIVFDTTVTGATWKEATARWTVQTDGGEQIEARFLILASGSLSLAKEPDIPGVANFAGQKLHTSAWPHDEPDLTGKRVAVIGTGSSGIQTVTALAPKVGHLLVLQRTPSYAIAAIDTPVGADEEAARREQFFERREFAKRSFLGLTAPFNDVPAATASEQERRETYERYFAMGGLPAYLSFNDLLFDPAMNQTIADFHAEKIRDQVQDKAIADRLVPTTYPWGTKRVCVETGYYRTFNRDNVELLDISATPIEEINATGVRIDGVQHDLDVIVFATGFDALTGAALKIDPVGRDGVRLSQRWAAGPQTYLGLCVNAFPNMFLVTGPGSPSVFSNMVISIEQHVEWIAAALTTMRERGAEVLEATAEAEAAWTAQLNAIAEATLCTRADSWYMGANVPGKPRAFLAFLGVGAYREVCEDVVANDYRGFILREGASEKVAG
ncbi:MAG: flavin-containing monooxygenase [Sporichthyaceae bacterium]|jgi:cyclohexanone monooxygenase